MPTDERSPAALRLARAQGRFGSGSQPVGVGSRTGGPGRLSQGSLPEPGVDQPSTRAPVTTADLAHAPAMVALRQAPRLHAVRPWWVVAAVILLALLVAVVAAVQGRPEQVLVPGTLSSEPPGGDSTTGGVTVHVAGAVSSPGLFRLPVGARVAQAVEAAGGPLPGTSLDSINLARLLNDGEQLVVGVPDQTTPSDGAVGPVEGVTQGATQIDLNRADSAQLQELPRVGPATAQKIIDYRTREGPFTSVEQLVDVPGIGEATLAALRDRAKV